MENHPLIKWIADAILSDWAVRVTVGVFGPAFIFFIAWVFGKEKAMKPEKRKFFIAGLIIIGVILYGLCGTIIQGARRISTPQITNPNFRCEIVNGFLGKTIEGNNHVVLMVKIVNSGSQSIAWKWHIKLDLVSGQTMEADAGENPLYVGVKDGPVVYPTGLYLPNILLESPILNGSAKKGWVGFLIKDISPEDMERIGNRFTISFQDSDGHVIEASETIRKKVVDDLLFGSIVQ